MTDSAEWDLVDAAPVPSPLPPPPPPSLAAWLDSAGLLQSAAKIISVSGAEGVDDLLILSSEDIETIIAEANLKLVGGAKLRRALLELKKSRIGSSDNNSDYKSATDDTHAAPETSTGEAAAESLVQETEPFLQEAIAICIDRSGSMGAPFAELHLNIAGADGVAMTSSNKVVTERQRMEAVKAMFYAFRDRIESLGNGGTKSATHQIGLLQFDDKVETLLDLTPELDRFEAIVDDMKKRGTTAIYSAILEVARMLEPVFASSGSTDLRILVLTDGNSNCGVSPEEALSAVNKIGAVVDAIIVGDQPDSNLRKIVATTGGLCFQMASLGAGFELLESESVVSLKARRGGAPKPAHVERPPVDFGSIKVKDLSVAPPPVRPSVDAAAAAKLSRVIDVSTSVDVVDSMRVGAGTTTSALSKRVLKELRSVASKDSSIWLHSGEGVHLFPSESDLTVWRALIEGPKGSPFEGGVFSLSVRIPSDYPFKPPAVRFETPVYHCNVNDSGAICLSILAEAWSPANSVPRALEAVRMMLATPDTDNALRQWIAELTISYRRSGGSDTRYLDEARQRTAADASCSVEDWRKAWGGAAS
uniref:UBC core domain-containing protein n=1 Tax=Haptolina brevifila TaxID=156173 RepID=A0A7S2H8K1_9EUKA